MESWKSGAPVPYSFLADTFDSIGDTSKRLEITRILTECFRSIVSKTPGDLLPAVYLCVNSVGPAHEGLEMGIGDSILMKVGSSVYFFISQIDFWNCCFLRLKNFHKLWAD